jgi:tRNA(His) guanylyltransferase
MVKRGQSNTEVENILKDTNSAQKNEILFTDFGINYNKLDDIYRRGTFLIYRQVEVEKSQKEVEKKIEDLKVSDDR